METVKRKCPRCNSMMGLDKYVGEHETCIICLENQGCAVKEIEKL